MASTSFSISTTPFIISLPKKFSKVLNDFLSIVLSKISIVSLYHLENSSSTSPSVIVENAPLNFVRDGAYTYSRPYYKGTDGNYWSATVLSSANAHEFAFNSGLFYAQHDNPKGFGLSVRYVAI